MRKFLPALLMLGGCMLATSASAAPAMLRCAGADMGPHYFHLWVDYDARTVNIGKQDTATPAPAAVPATVSTDQVVWDASGGGGDKYHYILNRGTGALAISAESYESGEITCKATP